MRNGVIITGAAGGIGQALVNEFVKAGYSVIATDIAPCPNLPATAKYVQADLARLVEDDAYAATVFDEVRAALNGCPLSALVNNAAVQMLDPVESLGREIWRRTLDVNLLAPFFWAQAFLSELEATSGSVINISSIHARLTKANFVAYATSKAALSGLTRSMAVEVGDRVRVIAIEPAAIDTPMLRAGLGENMETYTRLKEHHPAKEIARPEALSRLVLAVATLSDAFITGTIIPYEGGIGGVLHDPDFQAK